jgi:hypothetical protein
MSKHAKKPYDRPESILKTKRSRADMRFQYRAASHPVASCHNLISGTAPESLTKEYIHSSAWWRPRSLAADRETTHHMSMHLQSRLPRVEWTQLGSTIRPVLMSIATITKECAILAHIACKNIPTRLSQIPTRESDCATPRFVPTAPRQECFSKKYSFPNVFPECSSRRIIPLTMRF